MVEYAFRENAHFQKGARSAREVAQVVGEHMEYLREQAGGKLTPDVVLEDARNPNSPLAPYFEWDDTEAARQYRIQQARGLIRSVVVRYRPTPDAPPRTVRAFLSTSDNEGRSHYTPSIHVMTDEQMRARAIRKAWDELQAFRKRYEELSEFAGLFASLDEIEASLPPVVAA